MNKITIKFQRLAHANDLPLPSYATEGAVGIDIAAAIDRPKCLQPGTIMVIPSGFAMEMPVGYEAQIRPRSGLALKHGITVANAPGTIDSDYRGEIAVILLNISNRDFTITRGMRIAQMVFAAVTKINLIEVDDLDDTDRASGGFGSTGL